MENKIQFAPNVMLIDAVYINKVISDMREHFSAVLNRELPPADVACMLECMALDAGIRGEKHTIQVVFIYDANTPKLVGCLPSDLAKELHNVAFIGNLGEFSVYSFQPSEMATREDLFIESLQLVGECKDTKRILAVPEESGYAHKLGKYIKEMKAKEQITLLGMNPPAEAEGYDFQFLGFAILQALGISPDEL